MVATLTLAGATAAGGEAPAGDSQPMAVTDDAVDHVVAISVDGLNPTAIRQLGPSRTPALHRLIAEGATTLNARTSVEETITLPNHSGMVTGRRIAVAAGGHGIRFNNDNGTTIHRHAGEYVASMFDVAHDRGRSTALYTAKDKFNVLNRSWTARTGAPDSTGTNQGRDKIDRYRLDTETTNVTRLIADLRQTPDHLSLVHLAHPDRSGHDHGFMSDRYLRAVEQADHQVGRILNAIDDNTRLRRHTSVILTADHGGDGDGHSIRTDPANYTVPFMVWGVGVPAGTDLYTLNGTSRRDPGTSRPRYDGTQPIRNGEVANLALDLLDLPPVRNSQFNARQDLVVR